MDCAYEIVHVINATQLIDSESYQRAFEPTQAGRLLPGFYVVLWTDLGITLRYDGAAHYVGPFPTRCLAEEAQARISSAGGVPSSARWVALPV